MMRSVLILGVLMVFCVVSLVDAQGADCMSKSICRECVVDAYCGWCAGIQMCLPGTSEGNTPIAGANFTCVQRDWSYDACQHCEQFGQNCFDCSMYSDCMFCRGGPGCKHVGSFPGCSIAPQCACDDMRTCGECSLIPGCAYCHGNSSCINATLVSDTDECRENCTCDIYRTCDVCNADGRCAWCSDTEEGACQAREATCTHPVLNCNDMCQTRYECTGCMATPGCGWCADYNDQCMNLETGNCDTFAASCPEDCGARVNCDACVGVNGTSCKWCDDDMGRRCLHTHLQGCLNPWVEKCANEPCKSGSSGFNAGSFFGGMFLIVGIFLVLGCIILVWIRVVKGKRIGYSVVD